MIHPNMCTMLSFVTTDAAISKELLQEALSEDIKDTYNMISVDGDTSVSYTHLDVYKRQKVYRSLIGCILEILFPVMLQGRGVSKRKIPGVHSPVLR